MPQQLDYIKDAKFVRHDAPDEIFSDIHERFPRKPVYEASMTMINRFHELKDVVDDEMISETLSEGFLFPAVNDCGVFIQDFGGIALYVVVSDKRGMIGVTMWAYVHDKREARDAGWSNVQIQTVRELDAEHWD